MKVSSNVNEVIRAVLNSLFIFYKKILHAPKAPKAQKARKAQKHESSKSTKTQSSKSTKSRKTQISEYATFLPLLMIFMRIKHSHFYFCSLFCVFVLFVRVNKEN